MLAQNTTQVLKIKTKENHAPNNPAKEALQRNCFAAAAAPRLAP